MIDPNTDDIVYEHDGHVAYISFNRPDQLNALTLQMRADTARCLYDADQDENIRAIIVTGVGNAFTSGMDFDSMTTADSERMIGLDSDFDDFTLRDKPIYTPIIAAVNGHCIAAGMEFLQVTDIRIAAEGTMFGLREPKWGFVPSTGSTVRLPRQLPYCYAMEFLLTGDLFPAEYALKAGLVNDVVPGGEVLDRAEHVANKIARNSPTAIRTIKEIVQRGIGHSMEEGFRIEAELGQEALYSDDVEEAQCAYEEGREPEY